MKKINNVIIVTGGAHNIGYDIVKELLTKYHKIIISYNIERPEVDILKKMGVIAIKTDFTSKKSTKNFIKQVKSQTNSIRAIIYNASIWIDEDSINEQKYIDMFYIHMHIIYSITINLEELLLKHKKKTDIIAISDWKTRIGHPKYIAYLSTKSGLESIIKSFAIKYAPIVSCNIISPGIIKFKTNITKKAKKRRLSNMAFQSEIGSKEIIKSILYLMNSTHISGQRIEIGGLLKEIEY